MDVVCFEVAGETECSTIEQLTAECEKTDPEFTTDECQGLVQNRRPPTTRITADDDNRGDGGRGDSGRGDSGRGSGGNSGGGNSGGGNSGGGSGKGAGGSAAGGGGMKSK